VSSFGRGFRNRNPLVLLAAAGVTILMLLGFEQLFVSGAWTTVPLKYCLRNKLDSFTYVSWTVGANKRTPPTVPAVYITGGSASREAIVSGPSLAAQIHGLGGPRVAAWDLGSINQNFGETMAVADNVPTAKPAWVLIGINPGRFTEPPATNEQQIAGRDFLLKSAHLQHYISSTYGAYTYSRTILPGIFSYLTSKAQQDGFKAFTRRAPQRPYVPHKYVLAKIHTKAQKEAMVRLWNATRYPVFHQNLQFNLALVRQILISCRQRGVHAVLLELPQNNEIIQGRFDKAVAEYQVPLHKLAAQFGVTYLDFNAAAAIPSADFFDLSHLVQPGRVIWQRRLAKALAALVGPDGQGVKSP
jgi:lysophospholipase L1-like esterase